MGIVPNPETRGKNYLGYSDEPWEKVYASEINGIKAQTYAIAASRSWQPNKAYLEGDICYPSLDKGKSFMMLECVVPGTTSTTEPTWGNINETQTDGSVTWLIKKIGSGEGGGGLSIGMTIQHLGAVPPEGFLALKGQEVGRLTYPELWDWVQNKSGLLVSEANWQTAYGLNSGNCGSYSDGDGTTTFRLPNIIGFLRLQGDSSRDVGEYQGDAIRNITGTFSTSPIHGVLVDSTANAGYTTGAFTKGESLVNTLGASSGARGFGLKIDTSLIVPTAEENRPKSITALFCVKAFDSAVKQGTVDITELANDVSNNASKINVLENNVNTIEDALYNQHLLEEIGWCKLPNGLILQWGVTTTATVVFPIAFPTKFIGAQLSFYNYNQGNAYSQYIGCAASSLTDMTVIATVPRAWLALGY